MAERPEREPDIVDRIMAYEQDDMEDAEVIRLFSDLIKQGTIRHLQGSYQRTANWMIMNGYLSEDGEILWCEE